MDNYNFENREILNIALGGRFGADSKITTSNGKMLLTKYPIVLEQTPNGLELVLRLPPESFIVKIGDGNKGTGPAYQEERLSKNFRFKSSFEPATTIPRDSIELTRGSAGT